MGWIDYRKAFDMVPHSWILECLQMFKVAGNVSYLVRNSMNLWKVELSSGKETLAQVNIRRGIFQGDSFSPLLFVIALIPLTLILRKCKNGYNFSRTKDKINHLLYMDDLKLFAKEEAGLDALIQTVRVFSSDFGMEFGIEKCAVVIMKRGKMSNSNGIKLPDDDFIKALNAEDGYKYLGVLESDAIMKNKMKEKLSKEYFRRVRKVLETKLNSRNLVKGINTWAASLMRYSAPFLDWTVDELKAIDRRARKLLTMRKAFHPKDDVDRLYMGRKDGGRRLISIEECVENSMLGLREYVENSNERLIRAAKDWYEVSEESVDGLKRCRAAERKERWKEKPMHGQFIRQTMDIADDISWAWLRNGTLKRETESLITAAQDQCIRTNYIKARIDKTQENSLCRMCGQKEETVMHIICECTKLAQKEYKQRHDLVGTAIHWELCQQLEFNHAYKWYEYKPESVLENEKSQLLWNFEVQTDHHIEARRPDLIIVDKEKKTCQIVDFAIPGDHRVEMKEREKGRNIKI